MRWFNTARAQVDTAGMVAAWDWLGTVSVRSISDQSWWAVPLAVALTGFWWVAARRAQRPGLLGAALVGAAGGTALGLVWP